MYGITVNGMTMYEFDGTGKSLMACISSAEIMRCALTKIRTHVKSQMGGRVNCDGILSITYILCNGDIVTVYATHAGSL